MENPDRTRVGDQPRGAAEHEWDVFVREESDDPFTAAGSVTAPDVEVATELAETLFGAFVTDIWLCRSDQVHRFSTRTLDDDGLSGE